MAIGWTVDAVTFRYPGSARPAIEGVSLRVEPALCTAVLGPNGSGKSTLLRLLLATLRPAAGTITFGERPLADWRRRELARWIGVVPQNEEVAFPITVRQLVAMGRYPHLGLLRPEGRPDRLAIDDAMRRCDVTRLADRHFETLSGGERQRVRIARALAQEPRVLALDEPTLALDIRHEMEIFELIRGLTAEGVTVVVVTHNLNLAARYADTLVLLDGGHVAAAGRPSDVLRREMLETVYGWPLRTGEHPGPGPDTGAIQVTPLARGEASGVPPGPAGAGEAASRGAKNLRDDDA
jgi:iron complex transport system ATP-binding protein